MGFVPLEEDASVVQCRMDDPPVSENQWNKFLLCTKTSSDGQHKYLEVKVHSDFTLMNLNNVNDKRFAEWAQSHHCFLKSQKLTETILAYHRPSYTSVAMLSCSTLVDKMVDVRNKIWRRLRTDHDIDLKTSIFDVVWLEHEVDGETVGIATVMTAEASCEEVEV